MTEQNQVCYQSQHHFLSDSPWSAAALMQRISLDTNAMLGDWQKQSYSIDESSNRKSGKHSVGVSSQYNGNLGKVENSQTGVYASLSSYNRVGIINARLFLPDEWAEDPARCAQAGVPKAAIVKKTKIELAIQMVRESLDAGVKFGWVNADGLYGSSYGFCKALDEMGQSFVVDVHTDQMVYLSEPALSVPEKKTARGRKPVLLKTGLSPIRVDDYLKGLCNTDFQTVKIRKGTKGWIKAKAHVARVWVWDGKEPQARERTLLIRKPDKKKGPVKFALSNIPKESKTLQDFAFMQAQRFWIERAFEDCKGELGMADYQVRKYNAWYHHQALVMFAMQYINKTKIENQENIPLLSVRDIRLQIIALLKKDGTQMEIEIDQMLDRHRQRINDIMRYYPENDYF
jgi:SRSO17 transposase